MTLPGEINGVDVPRQPLRESQARFDAAGSQRHKRGSKWRAHRGTLYAGNRGVATGRGVPGRADRTIENGCTRVTEEPYRRTARPRSLPKGTFGAKWRVAIVTGIEKHKVLRDRSREVVKFFATAKTPKIRPQRIRVHTPSRRPVDTARRNRDHGGIARWKSQSRSENTPAALRSSNGPGSTRSGCRSASRTRHRPTRSCLRLGYGKDLEQVGPKSRSVMLRLATSCAGWTVRPTATEFYEAVRAAEPTGRQRAILGTFAQEAEWWELIAAWAERAYTIRQLVTALHRSGHAKCYAARWINGWAR